MTDEFYFFLRGKREFWGKWKEEYCKITFCFGKQVSNASYLIINDIKIVPLFYLLNDLRVCSYEGSENIWKEVCCEMTVCFGEQGSNTSLTFSSMQIEPFF